MRIQHNIMAMNAYRNYNLNNKALSGNLEKLSSGYKINRAGDDAAGLAISEKMRAQITGLNAASKNVKDGISLVKTAEGAMQEIQDMLNRMDYLATQSANGTYDNEVDRKALQKEVNQLNEEINRIAESANFNGIKLLDGTWDTDAVVKAQEKLDEAMKPVTADAVYNSVDSKKLIADGVVLAEVSPGDNVPGGPDNIGKNTVLETGEITGVKPSFKVTLNGTGHVMTGTGTTDIDLEVDGTKITITETDIKALYTDKETGDKVTAEELAEVFAKKINGTGAGTANGGTGAVAGQFVGTSNDKLVWNVKANGETLEFNLDAANTPAAELVTPLNEHYTVTMGAGANGTTADAVTGEVAATKYSLETVAVTKATAAGANDATSKITVNYTDEKGAAKTAEVTYSAAGAVADAETQAKELVEALKKDTGLAALFDITSDANGKIKFEAKTEGETKVSVTKITAGAGVGTGLTFTEAGGTTTAGVDKHVPGTIGYTNYGTVDVQPGVPAASGQLANTVIDLNKIGIEDGTKITLGNTEYTFAVGPDSKIDTTGANVIDLTKFDSATADALKDAATQMSQIANDIFSVSHTGDDGKVGIQQLEKDGKHVEEGKMTTMDDLMNYIKVETVDADATAEAQEKLDAEQAKKVADAQAKLDAAVEKGGKSLNLQIGDTSEEHNRLGVKIGSMKTTALGVDGLSISTPEDAAAAIDTIKNAINYVSGVRGDLGAYQNRLEHTSNNLSVMAENIQDAESTIRDTDVAEEMMSYVKNNILVQSAQAMLAQANQVPQGVLQLLG